LTADIVSEVKTVYDPEIPADIYELGLIYKIDIDDDHNVAIVMTLTAPGCPAGRVGAAVSGVLCPHFPGSELREHGAGLQSEQSYLSLDDHALRTS
jgi:hypothetical protein